MIKLKNIKDNVVKIKELLINPKKEWNIIKNEKTNKKELVKTIALPFSIICGFIVFIGQFIEYDIYTSFNSFLVSTLSPIASIYCGILILKEITTSNSDTNETDCAKLIIYSSLIFYTIHSIAYFFNTDSIIRQLLLLIQFVCVITIWNGVQPILKLNNSNRASYTIIVSLIVIILPLIFEKLFSIIFNVPLASI